MKNRLLLKESFKIIYPVSIGFIPLGLACGMLLHDVGFSVFAVFFMSALVYGGASQFMVASMIVAGANVPTMILMTFFLNLRHLLMSSSLSRYFKNSSNAFILFFTHTLADESYAVNYNQFKNHQWDAQHALMTNQIPYLTWVLSATLGGVIGEFVQIDTVVMNYVLISMFICLLVIQLTSWLFVLVAAIAGGLTLLFMVLLKHNISLIIATLLAATIGYYIDQWLEQKKAVAKS
ncbi:AzlC family ABC transporter permease [Isobaculum melis]|uniref:4-azaleucine resistance probable transporter AzlC n=1 Tax=Isobaculum melis TaxID=142588 RepID=A0A1H9PP26_9LACT|nr:AzlC family ABC transporter permease [Isobaculum melis]SER50086.1 4-azaleucine resistance probable transporter AzlC [Isobaculum melis]